jgi:hypothetical protein
VHVLRDVGEMKWDEAESTSALVQWRGPARECELALQLDSADERLLLQHYSRDISWPRRLPYVVVGADVA